MNELLVFRSYYSEEEAGALIEFLVSKGITAELTRNRPVLDRVYIGADYDRSFHVSIADNLFNTANQLLDEQIEKHLSEIDNEYYLYEFSNDELEEIIQKPDEWSNQDNIIAGNILRDRGVSLTHKEVFDKKQDRLLNLGKPEKEGGGFIILGYLFAILFGVFGIPLGLMMMTARKTLPDGNRPFVYDKNTRDHGKVILLISIIISALVFLKGIELLPSF